MNQRRVFRKSIGATLSEVGRMVGVSKQAVSAWERGTLRPSGEMEAAWATALKDLATKAAKARAAIRL